MTAVQPEQVTRRTCRCCGGQIPLRPDGLLATHYLRYGNEQPRRRKPCPGGRRQPREGR